MAFILSNWDASGVQPNSSAPGSFKYNAGSDQIATVKASGYFNAVSYQLDINDLIYVSVSNPSASGSQLRVTQVSPNVEVTDLVSTSATLPEGNLYVGDAASNPAAIDFSTSGNIGIGDGTTFNSTAMSGDVTIDSAGVTTLGNSTVDTANLVDASVRPGTKMFLEPLRVYIGQNDNTAASFQLSGDLTMQTTAGVTVISSRAVNEAKIDDDTIVDRNMAPGALSGKVSRAENSLTEASLSAQFQVLVPGGVASTTTITAPYNLRVTYYRIRNRGPGAAGNSIRLFKNGVSGINNGHIVNYVANTVFSDNILIYPNDEVNQGETIDIITTSSGNNFPASDVTIHVVRR